jgi:hypothetical protein
VAHAVIGLLLAGSMYDIVRDQEHWPFSQYPMFSTVWRAREFTWHRLYGVTETGEEFALVDHGYITPFDQSRLPKALRQIARQGDSDRRLRQAVADCFARYHDLRNRGTHAGPPLRALRLYEVHWILDPQGRNVDRPDRRKLLSEYVGGS